MGKYENLMLLVGAPFAQTIQPGVEKGGAVYKCSIDKSNACHQVPFDRSGSQSALNNATMLYEVNENKTLQWFGATLQSSGPNGVVVAMPLNQITYMYSNGLLFGTDTFGLPTVQQAGGCP
ncbi:hypothetical protein CHUAL_013466 [Chamberlinius hualienensis]